MTARAILRTPDDCQGHPGMTARATPAGQEDCQGHPECWAGLAGWLDHATRCSEPSGQESPASKGTLEPA